MNRTVLLLACLSFPVELTAQQVARDTTRLSLPAAASLAIAAHPSLGAARAAVDDARARLSASKAPLWPTLGADASLTQFQEPMLVAPIHGFVPELIPPFDRTLIRGNVALGYTLFDGGARLRRIRGASATATASEADLAAATQDVVTDVARAYLTVLSGSGVVDATARQLEALRAERDRAARFVAEGRAARVEQLRVEAQLEGARAESLAVALDVQVAEYDLARLTGLDVARTRAARLVPYRLAAGFTTEPADSLRARALEGNPDVERALRQADAADAARGVARAAWLPELRAGAAYNGYGSAAGDFSAEWQAGLTLSYPIFVGGRRSRDVAAADARYRAASERSRLVELGVRSAVDRAVAASRAASARVTALTAATAQSEEVVRIERLALDAGAGVQSDYLRAEAALLSARAALVEARHVEIAARIELARATGVLTLDWLAEHLEVAP